MEKLEVKYFTDAIVWQTCSTNPSTQGKWKFYNSTAIITKGGRGGGNPLHFTPSRSRKTTKIVLVSQIINIFSINKFVRAYMSVRSACEGICVKRVPECACVGEAHASACEKGACEVTSVIVVQEALGNTLECSSQNLSASAKSSSLLTKIFRALLCCSIWKWNVFFLPELTSQSVDTLSLEKISPYGRKEPKTKWLHRFLNSVCLILSTGVSFSAIWKRFYWFWKRSR